MAARGKNRKLYFELLLLNQKANWLKTVGSIGVTYWSKIAKIVPIGNPRWLPRWPSWKSIFLASSESKGQMTQNLVRYIWVTCRSKIAKIVLVENPRLLQLPPFWKSLFNCFSWTERPIDLHLYGNQVSDAGLSWPSYFFCFFLQKVP